MPKRAKIITDFREYHESELSDAVMLIINCLKMNSDLFIGLPVPVVLLKKQLKKFNKIRNSPVYQGQTPDTKKSRSVLQKSLSANGKWLNDMAYGNVSLLTKTGYPFHEKSKAQGILPKTILTLTATKSPGRLKFAISIIRIQNIRYGIMYTFADTPEKDPSKWRFYYCSKKDGIISDLVSKKEYKFVSFGMGSDNRLQYSNPVFMSAQ